MMLRRFKFIRKDHIYAITRQFWGLVFTCIIALAIIVQLGRQAFPLLNDYRDVISHKLGEHLGVVISVGSINAQWSGLKPKLALNDLTVSANTGELIFSVSNSVAELSIFDSILQGGLSWRRIVFERFKTQLIQDADGRWNINGYSGGTANDKQAFTIDDPFDIFLFGRRVEINEAYIDLHFNTGLSSTIEIPKINLENDRYFHRMTAALKLDSNDQAFRLVVEGYGDPRSEKEFSARGYLQLKNFSTERVVAAIAGDFWEGKHDAQWKDEQRLSLELWFDGSALNGMHFIGRIDSNGIPIKLDKEFVIPNGLNSSLSGYVHPEAGWQVNFNQLQIQWMDQICPISTVQLSGKHNEVKVTTPQVDVAAWLEIVSLAGLNKIEKINDALSQLKPKGILDDVSVKLTSKDEGYFLASAYVRDASVSAFLGSPAMTNVNGYMETSLHHGAINLNSPDGFSMFLPKVYKREIAFSEARGIVDWRIDPENHRAYISSGLLRVKSEGELAHGYLHLELPFSRQWGDAKMNLMVGASHSKVLHHQKYVPNVINEELKLWLNDAIKSGDISQGQFLYSGSLDSETDVSPSILARAHFNDTQIEFHPLWPDIRQAKGVFDLENVNFYGQLTSAISGNIHLSDSRLELIHTASGLANSLKITGSAEGESGQIKSFLLSSPVADTLESAIGSWDLSGPVKTSALLEVPLSLSSDGTLDVGYDFDIRLLGVDIDMTNINLPLKKVSGLINFSSADLLTAQTITGELWGEPFSSRIESVSVEGSDVKDLSIHTSGDIQVKALGEWSLRPELGFASGKTKVNTHLYVPLQEDANETLQVSVNSDLIGVSINLPQPLAKLADQPKKFSGYISMSDEREEYDFTLENQLHLQALNQEGKASAVTVGIHSSGVDHDIEKAQLTSGVVALYGVSETFDLALWSDVIDQYQQYTDVLEAEHPTTANKDEEYLITMDAYTQNVLIGDTNIEDMRVKGRTKDNYWSFDVHSPMLAGEVRLYEDDTPLTFVLDYLVFDDTEETVPASSLAVDQNTQPPVVENDLEEESVFAGLDFDDLVPMNIQVKDVRLGEQDLGRWQFELHPQSDEINVSHIVGEIQGLNVGSQTMPASLLWAAHDHGYSTYFSGDIFAKDLGDVLLNFDQEKILTSKSARISVATDWPGAPDQFKLTQVKGLVDFQLKDGSFIKGAEAGENPLLRLIALLNFDTLARRLKLDFSDLAAKGYAYDTVSGNLTFDRGRLLLKTPVELDSSSSKMQLAGMINLEEEKIDAQLVATLPVAGNLAVAAAFIAGLPAAVGVYIVSKLFKKQVDKASSITYAVTGDWANPKIKVKGIFGDSAAKDKGMTLDGLHIDGVPIDDLIDDDEDTP